MKHNHQPFEHYESEPKDRKEILDQNNLILIVVMGITVLVCLGILYAGIFMSEVSI